MLDDWKPKIDSSMEDLRIEVGALRKTVNRVVLDMPTPAASGILPKPASAAASPPAGKPIDGPSGHRHDSTHRETVFGSVYTHTHLPVTGMVPSNDSKFQRSSSLPPPLERVSDVARREFESRGVRSGGRVPKVAFPKFDGDNPKLWISRCEDYFELYNLDPSVWIKFSSMHFIKLWISH